jgi:hypothetical protein
MPHITVYAGVLLVIAKMEQMGYTDEGNIAWPPKGAGKVSKCLLGNNKLSHTDEKPQRNR